MSDIEVRVSVEGIDRAVRNLHTLERKMIRRIVSSGVRAADKEIVTEARLLAPVRTGALRRSIRASVKMDRVRGAVVGTIQSKSTKSMKRKGQDAYYAHMVVGGTRPHDIKHATFEGRTYAVVHHPGAKPNPFMERAARHVFARAVNAFNKAFNEKLNIEVAALPK